MHFDQPDISPDDPIIKMKGHQEKLRDDSKCTLPDQNHVITIIVTCKGFAIQELKDL